MSNKDSVEKKRKESKSRDATRTSKDKAIKIQNLIQNNDQNNDINNRPISQFDNNR